MPYPNYHAARVREPDQFQTIKALRTFPNGVIVYGGQLKGKPSTTKTQAYRFPKDKFSVERAKTWLDEHGAKVVKFEPAKDSDDAQESITSFSVMEAVRPTGKKVQITIIESGWSLNSRYYSPETLREAASLFEGAPINALIKRGMFDHSGGNYAGEKMTKIGILENVKYVNKGEKVRLIGNVNVTNDFFRDTFLNMNAIGDSSLGFSIDASGKVTEGEKNGKNGFIVESILKVNSVDLVSSPAAGGKVDRIVASTTQQENKMENLETLVKQLKGIGIEITESLEGKTIEEQTDIIKEQLAKAFAKVEEDEKENADKEVQEGAETKNIAEIAKMVSDIMKKKKKKKDDEDEDEDEDEMKMKMKAKKMPAKESDESEEVTEAKKLLNEMKKQQTEIILESAIRKDNALSENPVIANRIRESFAGKVATEEEIMDAIKREKEYYSNITESGTAQGVDVSGVEVGMSPMEKIRAAVRHIFTPDDEKIKESFYKTDIQDFTLSQLTNMWERERMRGSTIITESTVGNLKESITTSSFPVILGEEIHRTFLQDYNRYQKPWIGLAEEREVPDFKTQNFSRIFGYDTLDTVTEGSTYTEFTSPSEESATLVPTKKGMLESITEETIINDDKNSLRDLPKRLAQAAFFTLNHAVFDTIIGYDSSAGINGATIYDGDNLYSSSQGNLLSSKALNITNYEEAMNAIDNLTDPSNGEPILFTGDRYLLVPIELGQAAYAIINSDKTPGNENNDMNKFKNSAKIIQINKAFLRSSSQNWYLVGTDPRSAGVMVGYLRGYRQPRLDYASSATLYDALRADKMIYRVKQVYGVALLDRRGKVGSIFA